MDRLPYLNWSDGREHFDGFENLPCCLCEIPTPMRSHAGEPVHKVCAEHWNQTHLHDPRRYTVPTRARPVQHDVGTWRFHSDGPTTDKRVPVLTTTDPPPPAATGRDTEQGALFGA
ncbi:hypothetical protein [Streptomyces sp. NPDC058855]|uniref:hypothetical protein n=1 Tax=Streptomyces sp. NPDC058855 TaxID=3346651 RepID=UPI0036C3EFE7